MVAALWSGWRATARFGARRRRRAVRLCVWTGRTAEGLPGGGGSASMALGWGGR